jgi:hypothetical protein
LILAIIVVKTICDCGRGGLQLILVLVVLLLIIAAAGAESSLDDDMVIKILT